MFQNRDRGQVERLAIVVSGGQGLCRVALNHEVGELIKRFTWVYFSDNSHKRLTWV